MKSKIEALKAKAVKANRQCELRSRIVETFEERMYKAVFEQYGRDILFDWNVFALTYKWDELVEQRISKLCTYQCKEHFIIYHVQEALVEFYEHQNKTYNGIFPAPKLPHRRYRPDKVYNAKDRESQVIFVRFMNRRG